MKQTEQLTLDQSFLLNALTDSCLELMILDTNAQTIRFLKSSNPEFELEKTYDIRSFKARLRERAVTITFEELKQLCDEHANGPILTTLSGKHTSHKWIQLNLSVPEDYSKNQPNVLLYTYALSENVAIVRDADMTHRSFQEFVLLNLETNIPVFYHVSTVDYHIHKVVSEYTFDKHIETTCRKYIHSEDASNYLNFFNIETLRSHFIADASPIVFYYRRRVGSNFRWVRSIIHRKSDFTAENPSIIISSADFHVDALQYIADLAVLQFEIFQDRKVFGITQNHYQDFLHLLRNFTEPYLFFIVIDLENDAYVSYKSGNPFHSETGRIGGCYSERIKLHIKSRYSSELAEQLLAFTDIDNLRKELQNKVNIEFSFTQPNGQGTRCIFSKFESRDALPTRIMCYGIPHDNEKKKLKIKTFGPFEVLDQEGELIHFEKKQSKQVLAYLVDKHGYPVTINDVVLDILEKNSDDLNAKKYASALLRKAMRDLTAAGYPDVIREDHHTYRIQPDAIDCDYYHILEGNNAFWAQYHNEYMIDYSWAEETNAELLNSFDIHQGISTQKRK